MITQRRWLWWATGIPVAMVLMALGAYQLAVHRLQAGILQAVLRTRQGQLRVLPAWLAGSSW